jgi:hypothetical protein
VCKAAFPNAKSADHLASAYIFHLPVEVLLNAFFCGLSLVY